MVVGVYVLATYMFIYKDGYRLVTVRTHSDFIMLPIGRPRCKHHDLMYHSVILS